MKKTITALISCALALFAFAGCSAAEPKGDSVPGNTTDENKPNDTIIEEGESREQTLEEIMRDKNVKGQVSELLSLEELVSFYLYGEKFPEDFASDELVDGFSKDVYDAETKRFHTKNADVIKTILDDTHYGFVARTGGFKVYQSDISITGGKYEYVLYMICTTYGDWGLQDSVTFVKETISVDIESGETNSAVRESVGHFSIDGKCTHVVFT